MDPPDREARPKRNWRDRMFYDLMGERLRRIPRNRVSRTEYLAIDRGAREKRSEIKERRLEKEHEVLSLILG